MPQTDLLDRAAERLADRSARLTPTRRRLLEVLDASSGPRTVPELQATLTDVPVSTLYRALTSLEEAQVVVRLHDTAGTGRYELAEWITGHHHHITCTVCGFTEDVAVDERLEAAIGRLLSDVAEEHGFRISGHHIEIEGVCPSCQHR